jgi:hypothetical protein
MMKQTEEDTTILLLFDASTRFVGYHERTMNTLVVVASIAILEDRTEVMKFD